MFSEEINLELESLSKSNNFRGLIGLAKDYSEIAIAISFSIYMDNAFIYLMSIIFIGSRQRALATILHDSAHRVLCDNTTLNDVLGKYFSGYLIFQSFTTYVRSHVINHHNFLGDEERDPDYKMYIRSGVFEAKSKREFIVKYIISPILLSKSPLFVYYLVKERFGNYRSADSIKIILYWSCILSFAYYFSVIDIVLFYWFVPMLTTFPMIGWYIELSEHYPIIVNDKDIYKTYNRFGNKFESYLTSMHNENYHLTHHLRADIPYWNIDKAHTVMLKAPEYRRINKSFGGIFTNQNKETKSIVSGMLDRYDQLEALL